MKAVTICEAASARLGHSATNGQDFEDCGLPLFGGCLRCQASIAAHNAYSALDGYLRCACCIGDSGFATTADFWAWVDRETSDNHEAQDEGTAVQL